MNVEDLEIQVLDGAYRYAFPRAPNVSLNGESTLPLRPQLPESVLAGPCTCTSNEKLGCSAHGWPMLMPCLSLFASG